jgi:hypothetical protein
MVVIHLCVKLSVFAVSMATAIEKIQNGGRCHGNQGIKWPPNTKILRFGRNLEASKSVIHMPNIISIKFHPIPSTLNCSRFL